VTWWCRSRISARRGAMVWRSLLPSPVGLLKNSFFRSGWRFHRGHAMDACLGGERDGGEGAAGGDGLACEETVGGGNAASQEMTSSAQLGRQEIDTILDAAVRLGQEVFHRAGIEGQDGRPGRAAESQEVGLLGPRDVWGVGDDARQPHRDRLAPSILWCVRSRTSAETRRRGRRRQRSEAVAAACGLQHVGLTAQVGSGLGLDLLRLEGSRECPDRGVACCPAPDGREDLPLRAAGKPVCHYVVVVTGT